MRYDISEKMVERWSREHKGKVFCADCMAKAMNQDALELPRFRGHPAVAADPLVAVGLRMAGRLPAIQRCLEERFGYRFS